VPLLHFSKKWGFEAHNGSFYKCLLAECTFFLSWNITFFPVNHSSISYVSMNMYANNDHEIHLNNHVLLGFIWVFYHLVQHDTLLELQAIKAI